VKADRHRSIRNSGEPTASFGPVASDTIAAPRYLVVLAFAAVYLIWGSTYLGIRYAIETIPPFLMGGLRHFSAGCILMLGLRCFSRSPFYFGTPREWRDAAIVGFLLLVCGNGGVTWAEQYVPSGITALMVAVVPLWMILFEWIRPGGRRPSILTIFGLALGFAGVWILVRPPRGQTFSTAAATGYTVLVLVSVLWAAGSIFSRHVQSSGSPLLAVSRQMISGGAILFLLGEIHGERLDLAHVSSTSWTALLYLALLGSLVGFTAYVWLMKASTPAQVSTYAYVNPAIAVFLGWSIGGEALSVSLLLGASIVLVSVIMVLKNQGPGKS